MRLHLLVVATLGLLLQPELYSQQGGDRLVGRPFATRSPVLATEGMVATSQPLATQVGLDILKKGGTAVDAAIAANAVLGLVEPTGSGIGGDLFAIVWDAKTKKLYGLNASGRSPRGMSLEELKKRLGGRKEIPVHGPLPVSVPGAVDGWFELHGKFGKLPMKEILAPAVSYAQRGFPLTQLIAYYWSISARRFPRSRDLTEVKNFKKTYLIDGRAPKAGEIFKNPDLARTYTILGEEGRDAFYRGSLAEVIDAYCKRVGCAIRKSDLEAHTSTWVEPQSVNYRGYDIWELPPNGQGIAALQMLNILEGYDLKKIGRNSAAYLHLMTEAKKLAFADRAKFYADPEFSKVPLAGLLSKSYAATRRRLINRRQVARVVDAGEPRLDRGDTIYLTTADAEGNMVSLIQSNYVGMGSGLVPDGLGFILQDRGALFALNSSHANVYAPGKRPFHTIIPAFITKDGQPWMSFGLMGGAMQPQGHVQVVCNLIDFGLNVQEAGDAARYRHEGSSQPTGIVMSDGGILSLESGISDAVAVQLSSLGHRVRRTKGGFGGYQAIRWDAVNKVYRGASEMRKDGQAAGF
ncbi:MAG: gamma-glutamyltransferase [Planctomycetota bacterium]